jgi:predicted RNA binding protein YcfA (HicA-like mRNA interferase family)
MRLLVWCGEAGYESEQKVAGRVAFFFSGPMISKWYHDAVPQKIRELIEQLQAAGFINRGGRGSHRNFIHPSGLRITISGKPGSDAKKYQERDVARVIREVKP